MTENAKPEVGSALRNIRIVLVGPTHPGNIGGAARAMKNSGLSDLRLVAPRLFPHPDADARAAGAEEILAQAVVVDTLEAAVADCHLVVGASARSRTIPLPSCAPDEAARSLLAVACIAPVALVFGRERTGLTNSELDRCQQLVMIPANPAFSSLNLASAVQVLGYELFKAVAGESVQTHASRAATRAEMHHFYGHLERVLIDLEFLNPAAPRKLMRRIMRLVDRSRPDSNEINILEGILTAIEQLGHGPSSPGNT
jgi:TrmH family RNA methyltransferase